jgi:hypothetical protein
MSLLLLLLFLLGLVLCLSARRRRIRAGFGGGRTISRDDVRLASRRYNTATLPSRASPSALLEVTICGFKSLRQTDTRLS